MSIRRKFSNTSDFVEPLQSTILCEYYLWVRWCNIREINGYYIYNGMKGNKLSFVHQQNSNLIIYFHTISTDIHSSNQTVENTYSFFSSNSYFMAQSSIPENREDDNDSEIKLNLAMDSPSSSGPSQSQSHSNDSTPCSSPPQSPNHKIPLRLTPKNSIDEYLYNHWVIKHDKHILYYTKDKDINSIDNEYPPSYGWKYNEKNQPSLPKQYNLINCGAPPPGITRIPMDNDNINHKNGIISHVNNLKNGQTNDINNNIIPKHNQTIPIPFDLSVHYIDVFIMNPINLLNANAMESTTSSDTSPKSSYPSHTTKSNDAQQPLTDAIFLATNPNDTPTTYPIEATTTDPNATPSDEPNGTTRDKSNKLFKGTSITHTEPPPATTPTTTPMSDPISDQPMGSQSPSDTMKYGIGGAYKLLKRAGFK